MYYLVDHFLSGQPASDLVFKDELLESVLEKGEIKSTSLQYSLLNLSLPSPKLLIQIHNHICNALLIQQNLFRKWNWVLIRTGRDLVRWQNGKGKQQLIPALMRT